MCGRRKLFPHNTQQLSTCESENLDVKYKNQKLLEEVGNCLKDMGIGK